MLLLNYDFYDIHSVLTMLRAKPEKEYNIENVEVICNRCIISLIISIRDNNETLYLGYRIDEQHDKDYFYLVPNGLSLPDEYIDELWDDFYEKIINDIFDILS